MRDFVLQKLIATVALVAFTACGKPPVTKPTSMLRPECEVLSEPAESADSITVALLDAVETEYAPWARNASEQLLFHHLYETLITVDCQGKVQAGLAVSWSRGEGGRRWTFELREDARFWDGTPVRASDVVWGWEYLAVEPMKVDVVIDSAVVSGDRVLHVYLKQPHWAVPRELSGTAFAVAKLSLESRWPIGSGPFRIVTSEREISGFFRRAITARPARHLDEPVIRFLETPANDARDLLEGGIDVMLTRDPAVIEYAAARARFATLALPWDRTYVLLSTSRAWELRRGSAVGVISSDLSDRLARDAVRGDACGHRPPSWWDNLYGCDELSGGVVRFPPIPPGAIPSSAPRRFLFDAHDPIARDLAERIVALAASDPAISAEAETIARAVPGLAGSGPRVIAEGVSRSELEASLRAGSDFAYVVPLPRRPPDPCYEALELMNLAPWLTPAAADFPRTLIPLVDTRPHVIASKGRFGLTIDWYGNVLIVGRTPGKK